MKDLKGLIFLLLFIVIADFYPWLKFLAKSMSDFNLKGLIFLLSVIVITDFLSLVKVLG